MDNQPDAPAPVPNVRYRVVACDAGAGIGEVTARATKLQFDRSWAAGPSGLPGPAELLCSAFAACLIKNVERFSQVLPFSYGAVEVEVEAYRQDRPPRFDRIRYVLTIMTDEPESRVDLLARNLRKHGTVYNTLIASCDVSGEVVAVAAGSSPKAGGRPGSEAG